LADAIKSVIIQSYTNWELILLDDGSIDQSYKIAQELAAKDSRIKLLSDGENRGLIYRLNQIIEITQGDYIGRMDSDDMMMPDKLEKQMRILIENDTIDIIDTAAYTINEKDEPTGMRGTVDLSSWDNKKVLKKALLFHPTVIAKTNWYKKNRYDQDFIRSEDFELWCRTFSSTNFFRIYEPLFLYREGKVNIKNYTASNRTHRKILRKYGPGVLSPVELEWEILRSHLKSTVYRVFAIFNMQYTLSSKRNDKLNLTQVDQVKTAIQRIKSWR
jgi:glycosyltransferase involved in cell wall biosynthesis